MTTFSMDTPNSFAVHYIMQQGYSVIPLKPKSTEPDIQTWRRFINEPPKQKTAVGWFEGKHAARNIGIVTGAVSKIVVLEVDWRKGGDESVKTLNFPKTPTVKTGNGRHHYFRYPEGLSDVKSISGFLPGLSLKSDGGYVVAPPSVGANGLPYQWKIAPWECSLAECPAEVIDVMLGKPSKTKQRHNPEDWLLDAVFGVETNLRKSTAERICSWFLERGTKGSDALAWMKLWNAQNETPMEGEELLSVLKSSAAKHASNSPRDGNADDASWKDKMNFSIDKILKKEIGEGSIYHVHIRNHVVIVKKIEDLINFRNFQRIVAVRTNWVPQMKNYSVQWPRYLNAVMQSRMKIIEMPPDAFEDEELKDLIRHALLASCDRNEKVLLDPFGVYENETKVYFKLSYIQEQVARRGMKVGRNVLADFLKGLKADIVSKRVSTPESEKKSHVVKCWRIEMEALKPSET